MSADQGFLEAQYSFGTMYDDGLCVAQDDLAVNLSLLNLHRIFSYLWHILWMKWYRMAADQGHAQAQFNLGVMYKNGQGVVQDYSAAMKWWRMAADQGHAMAQFNLFLIVSHLRKLNCDRKGIRQKSLWQ